MSGEMMGGPTPEEMGIESENALEAPDKMGVEEETAPKRLEQKGGNWIEDIKKPFQELGAVNTALVLAGAATVFGAFGMSGPSGTEGLLAAQAGMGAFLLGAGRFILKGFKG